MRGTVDSIKERLDIVEVISTYLKLEKAGQNYKGKCPFHNEKTASFSVSTGRQGYYCFGCGAKGDIFTFVQEMEGVDFKGALKILAERAGVEIEYSRGASKESKDEKEKLYEVLLDASAFFESKLIEHPEAGKYLLDRGISADSIKEWKLGFAPEEWRALYEYMKTLGHTKEILVKAGLIKPVEGEVKEPYDVFRGRLIFPLFDASGRVIAFSGRALQPDAVPKYLNTPETALFQKGEVLYGLDRAKDEIRKKNFTVLVEGQIDLVLSHQAGVKNTVASSGTAFTAFHLDRLKRLSPRIILAFDGDTAGEKAALKSSILGLSLGMEVKVAALPTGKDPADLVRESPEALKDVLRGATHAIEHVLRGILDKEKDKRKAGKAIEKSVLPLLVLLQSAIERSHFVSLISKRSGIREEIVWEDLRKAKAPETNVNLQHAADISVDAAPEALKLSLRERIESRIEEMHLWQKEFPDASLQSEAMKREKEELSARLELSKLDEERAELRSDLEKNPGDEDLIKRIHTLDKQVDEQKRKMV